MTISFPTRRSSDLCPIKLPSPPPRIAGPPTGKKLSPMHWPAAAHGGIIRNHLDSRKPLSMNAAKRAQIFARLQAADPHPTTGLEYGSTFQLLVAVMLSAQATDKSVNLATKKFFPRHGTPQGLLALGQEALADFIKTIGLYKTKSANVIKTCQRLIDHYQRSEEHTSELQSLMRISYAVFCLKQKK